MNISPSFLQCRCINISNILNGNWANGVHVRFEWFSSGEFHIAMLFSAIYQRMKEVNKKDTNNRDIIWAIDEPEMHMHPELGRNFIDKLNRAMQQFKDRGFFRVCQFIFATHSPFLVQNLGRYTSTLTLVDKTKNQISTTAFEKMPQLRFPGREELSFNLIMYQIFGIPTVELHNELYGVLQELTHRYDEKNFEKWLVKGGSYPKYTLDTRKKRGSAITIFSYTGNIHSQFNPSSGKSFKSLLLFYG